MARTWRTARVFISSTFRDMHAERDCLVKVVFPELRERLLPHRIYLEDIDLRWGITEEESKRDKVLDLCLQKIDECRPFFIGILGERYGWIPTTPLSREAARRFARYGLTQLQIGKSVTELEILFGVLLMDPRMKGRSFFYFRDPRFLNTAPKDWRREVRHEFQEFPSKREVEQLGYKQARREAAIRRLKLRRLKQKIRAVRELGYPVFENYPRRWDPTTPARPTKTQGRSADLDEFGRQVRDQLWEAIKAEFKLPDQVPEPTALDEASRLAAEADDQARFAESRLRVYVGREHVQRELVAYALDNEPKPCLVTGPSGSGKSAALSRFIARAAQDLPDILVIAHFIGASSRSTALRDVLKRLCSELYNKLLKTERQAPLTEIQCAGAEAARQRQTVEQEFTIPDAVTPLVSTWQALLKKIPEKRRVVIVLDALNLLEEHDRARELWWLPRDILDGPCVKIIASCIVDPKSPEAEQDPVAGAFRHRPYHPARVGPLSVRDTLTIVRRVPSLSAKTIDRHQRRRLLENPATANPLYLRVALEELRGFGSYEALDDRIAALPREGLLEEIYEKAGFTPKAMREAGDPLTALFVQVIQRLETDFDPEVARSILTLLASARRGLSNRELLGLIEGPNVALDASTSDLFSIVRQLRPYLVDRGGLMGFFHDNILRAVDSYYFFEERHRHNSHSRLAGYLENRADIGGDCSWRGDDARALTELPFHRTHAGLDATALMTDIRYVEARTRLTDVPELVSDYDRYASHGVAGAWRDMVRRHAQRLASHPGAFFALAYHDGPPAVRESACCVVREGLWLRAWLHPEAAWLPERSPPSRRESVVVRAVYAFDRSSATDLADERRVAFYVARLGEVKLVDLDHFVELPSALTVRRGRPLRLAASPDAHWVALAYEDGWVEVYRLDLADDGAVRAQSFVTTVPYLVPESEPPVLAWNRGVLGYQPDLASIGRLDLNTDPLSKSLCTIPAETRGELSGWVALAEGHVVTLRQPGHTTAVVVLGPRETVESLRLPSVEVTTICPYAANGIALGSVGRFVEVYRRVPGWTRVARVDSGDPPACLAWDGCTLAWISEDAHFHCWDPSVTDPQRDLGRFPAIFPANRHVTARRLCARRDGSYDALTDSEVFRFAVTADPAPEPYPLRLVLQGPDGAPYAVQERDHVDWLLDMTLRTERRLESFDRVRLPFLCAVDGTGRLLAASITGGAHVVDLTGGRALAPVATPDGTAAVVGDPVSGFWLVDRAGTIFTITRGGCIEASALRLMSPGGAMLRSARGYLVWAGTCQHVTASGTDVVHAVVVFRAGPGRAEPLGTPVFAKSDGVLCALDLSPDGKLLVAVFERSSHAATLLRVGTPEDFVQGRATERVVSGIDPGVFRARVVSDGSSIDLLCERGALFRVDIASGQVRSVLSLDEPITEMAVGPARGPELLLIQAKAKPLACLFEEPDSCRIRS